MIKIDPYAFVFAGSKLKADEDNDESSGVWLCR